jgi:hypothetical protein
LCDFVNENDTNEVISMVIHFSAGGKEHAYLVPFYEFPINIHRPGPGPVNMPQLLADASLLASVEHAANRLSDAGVRDALRIGITAAVEALSKRGGTRISLETAGGAASGA